MRLRNVESGDLDIYIRIRCDPVMMSELGGPLPRAGLEAKVRSDVESAAAGESLIKMIVLDEAMSDVVAGSVVLWSHEEGGETISEVGWMVLPEFQGRGLAKLAVRALLESARDEKRWGLVHAFPGVTNAASNGVCRSVGFTHIGERDVTFVDRVLHTNHWIIDPGTDLA